jgi:small subunit ribosomal protein S16
MVKIRLMRMGATKRPFFRVVVADSRSPRDGRFIENIGKYHPLEDPSLIEIDEDRALYWLDQGAQPTEQVRNLLRIRGVWERFEASKGGAAKAGRPQSAPASSGGDAPPAPSS